jgi:Domain of unknown function (DUF1840)
MIYEFKSKATGNLIMTQGVGDAVLQAMGKTISAKGIITVGEMPAAISALKAAVQIDKSRNVANVPAATSKQDDGNDQEPIITLSQRALPMLEMLHKALLGQQDIVWGV